MLARIFEAGGFSTILVSNMPFWVEKIGTPRCLAVEFPFGHILGRPNDPAGQLVVIQQALQVLETSQKPGTIVHSPEIWPLPQNQAIQDWQPPVPSPVVQALAPKIREILRQRRDIT